MRLLLISDHALFRDGLSHLLTSEYNFDATCSDGIDKQATQDGLTGAHVVLLDSNVGEERVNHFLLATRHMGYAGKVLILTAGMTAKESAVALQLGAAGIFFKHNPCSLLARIIRRVDSGEVWVDQRIIRLMAESGMEQQVETSVGALTERQQRVLQGILEGLTNKEIGNQLGSSEGSVKATLQSLFQKTRVRTRSQLVRFALELPLSPGSRPA